MNQHSQSDKPLIILYRKYYVYRTRKRVKELNLYEVLLDCEKQLQIKYEIMTGNGQTKYFTQSLCELQSCRT